MGIYLRQGVHLDVCPSLRVIETLPGGKIILSCCTASWLGRGFLPIYKENAAGWL